MSTPSSPILPLRGTLSLLAVAGVFATGMACGNLQPVTDEALFPIETGLDGNNANGGNNGGTDTADTGDVVGGNNGGNNGANGGNNSPPRAVVTSECQLVNDDGECIPGGLVEFDGTDSSDLDGDELSFAWTLVQKPVGSAASLDDPTSDMPSMFIDQDGDYQITVQVSDGQAFDEVNRTLKVVPDNLPPKADAGIDQRVTVGNVVYLTGAGSTDPDGDDLEYNWRFISRPPGSVASLSGASIPSTAIAPTFVADAAGIFTIELMVTDGSIESQPDLVQVSATDPNASNAASSSSSSSGDCLDCAAEAGGVAAYRFSSGGLASSLGLLVLPVFVAIWQRRREDDEA